MQTHAAPRIKGRAAATTEAGAGPGAAAGDAEAEAAGSAAAAEASSAPRAAGAAGFGAMLLELKRWVGDYGSCYVPSGVHDDGALGRWVQRMRKAGGAGGTLTAEQRAALDGLGFVWRPSQVGRGLAPRVCWTGSHPAARGAGCGRMTSLLG